MKVCLIRHGETAWSLSGQHTGKTDLDLTANGQDQARSLAPRLQAMGFTRVLVSPRLRARRTCELAGLGGMAEVEADLAEWDYGEHEGRRSADIRLNHPGWDIWRDGCPGGESPADISARADRLITQLHRMGGSVALFSHGQFGVALATRWIGLALIEGQHFTLHPASISLLGTHPQHQNRRVIELWNECPHEASAGASRGRAAP
jgi:probable phosphoglycerate mutase